MPTRGLLGYRTEFINDTVAEGTIVRRFKMLNIIRAIFHRTNGAVIAQEERCNPLRIVQHIGERATLFIDAGTKVYEGAIVGIDSRNSMVVQRLQGKGDQHACCRQR